MAKLSSTTIFGKLRTVGDALIQGAVTVKEQITAENGIEVEGGPIDEYATVRAGPNATNGHLMLDANGGNVYLARDGGDTRINNGKLEDSLDANDQLIYNVNSLRDNASNCELVFDSSNNRFEFEDGSGNRTEALFSRIYLGDNIGWFDGNHDDLSGVSASDHHSKYTDSEARTAVDGSSLSNLSLSNKITVPIASAGDSASEGEIAVSPDGTLLVAKDV